MDSGLFPEIDRVYWRFEAGQKAGSGRLIGRATHVQTITAAFQDQYSFLMIKRGRGADDEFSIPELAGLVGFGHFGDQFIVSVKALRRWNCRRFERGAAFIHAISLGCRSGFDNSQTAAQPRAGNCPEPENSVDKGKTLDNIVREGYGGQEARQPFHQGVSVVATPKWIEYSC